MEYETCREQREGKPDQAQTWNFKPETLTLTMSKGETKKIEFSIYFKLKIRLYEFYT